MAVDAPSLCLLRFKAGQAMLEMANTALKSLGWEAILKMDRVCT